MLKTVFYKKEVSFACTLKVHNIPMEYSFIVELARDDNKTRHDSQ